MGGMKRRESWRHEGRSGRWGAGSGSGSGSGGGENYEMKPSVMRRSVSRTSK